MLRCHLVAYPLDVYRASVVGGVLLEQGSRQHGVGLQVDGTSALRGFVAQQDAVAYAAELGHYGCAAILVVVDAGTSVSSCVCPTARDEYAFHHASVLYAAAFHGEQVRVGVRRVSVVRGVSVGGYLGSVGLGIGIALAVEDIVRELHHVVCRGKGSLGVILAYEVCLVARDIPYLLGECGGVVGRGVVGVASPYLHAPWHHYGVETCILVGRLGRAQRGITRDVSELCSTGECGKLHHHLHVRVQVLVPSCRIQHLLQLLPAGCIGRVRCRRRAESVLRYVVVCRPALALHVWRDAIRPVVLVCTYIHRTVLYTVGIVHVHTW